jgi:hypothetical protein
MTIIEALAWLENTWLGVFTRDVYWVFPALETVHFMGLCIMFGSLLVIDLRVLGVARFIPMRPALSFIPVALVAFMVNLVSGIGFFSADPFRYYTNIAFRWKMILILVAGLNALWFWLAKHGRLSSLPDGVQADITAKFIAGLSLVLWIAVIVLGRLIPYVE